MTKVLNDEKKQNEKMVTKFVSFFNQFIFDVEKSLDSYVKFT